MTDARPELRRLVMARSHSRCEYCRVPVAFDELPACLDHIIAVKHRGETSPDNLALSCSHDNSFKGDNIAGLDPESDQLSRLFNPRTDDWSKHFALVGGEITGQTPIGRTTVYVLNINDPVRVMIRRLLCASGHM
jgi:hypothetical protein